MRLDFLDICLLLVGILFTITKLDAQSRSAETFPHVAREEFERWQRLTVSIYRTGLTFCFARVLFHLPWSYLVAQRATSPLAPSSWRSAALAVDLVCLLLVAVTFLRARSARALRRELGIVLTPLTPAEQRGFEEAAREEAAASTEQRD